MAKKGLFENCPIFGMWLNVARHGVTYRSDLDLMAKAHFRLPQPWLRVTLPDLDMKGEIGKTRVDS